MIKITCDALHCGYTPNKILLYYSIYGSRNVLWVCMQHIKNNIIKKISIDLIRAPQLSLKSTIPSPRVPRGNYSESCIFFTPFFAL